MSNYRLVVHRDRHPMEFRQDDIHKDRRPQTSRQKDRIIMEESRSNHHHHHLSASNYNYSNYGDTTSRYLGRDHGHQHRYVSPPGVGNDQYDDSYHERINLSRQPHQDFQYHHLAESTVLRANKEISYYSTHGDWNRRHPHVYYDARGDGYSSSTNQVDDGYHRNRIETGDSSFRRYSPSSNVDPTIRDHTHITGTRNDAHYHTRSVSRDHARQSHKRDVLQHPSGEDSHLCHGPSGIGHIGPQQRPDNHQGPGISSYHSSRDDGRRHRDLQDETIRSVRKKRRGRRRKRHKSRGQSKRSHILNSGGQNPHCLSDDDSILTYIDKRPILRHVDPNWKRSREQDSRQDTREKNFAASKMPRQIHVSAPLQPENRVLEISQDLPSYPVEQTARASALPPITSNASTCSLESGEIEDIHYYPGYLSINYDPALRLKTSPVNKKAGPDPENHRIASIVSRWIR